MYTRTLHNPDILLFADFRQMAAYGFCSQDNVESVNLEAWAAKRLSPASRQPLVRKLDQSDLLSVQR